MIPLDVVGEVGGGALTCNQCGECCRHGGEECSLRRSVWSGRDIPVGFDGVCELLTADGKCSSLLALVERGGQGALLEVGIIGFCNFPLLRKVM